MGLGHPSSAMAVPNREPLCSTRCIAPCWCGFQTAELTQDYALFADTWPAPVREHWKLYWWAWLMPDRDIKDLVQGYIGGQQNQDYIQRTGDWRGNASLYRTYCRAMGTMNFNHWAANGALLGGRFSALLNGKSTVLDPDGRFILPRSF